MMHRIVYFALSFIGILFYSCDSADKAEQPMNKAQQETANEPKVMTLKPKEGNLADAILPQYLALKEALANDDYLQAKICSRQLLTAIKMLAQKVPDATQNLFVPLKDTLQQHVLAIIKERNITSQRAHFRNVSNSVFELVMNLGTKQKLYKAQCPMDNSEWLSKEEAIRNPYQGQNMLDCGSVKARIN